MATLGGEMAYFLTAHSKVESPFDTLLLEGGLGVGKTCFARGFVQRLMGDDTVVPSPTFTLLQQYQREALRVFHYDLYRLNKGDSLYDIGWEDVGYQGISLIEWPERMDDGDYPRDYWRLVFKDGTCDHTRRVDFIRAENARGDALRTHLESEGFEVRQ